MTNDTRFLTNEKDKKLLDRFVTLIKDTRYFDCLVGYFYTTGFYSMYKSLEKTDKIRVLIGISTDKQTFNLIQESKKETQTKLEFSHKEIKDQFSNNIESEFANSEDSPTVEEAARKFIEWLKSGKLEVRVYPAERIHAKLYVMTFKEGDREAGRVITGSSNFTEAGLKENLELNVELKDNSDYEYAKNKFEELWANSVDVSEKYIETIKTRTWLNDEITPYELFLKFLYEYLKEKIQLDKQEIKNEFKPDNFMELEYQKDAVRDAKAKLEEYGGVFISDVVGLGKTFMTTMLVQQLDGRTLVLAPPMLIDKNNPGSWWNAFREFGIRGAEIESIGKLDDVLERGLNYDNVVIDEAHRFRTENTQMFEKLFKICRGKRVILVSATPLNNTPLDILSQIKLFQNAHKSTLPNPKVRDLEKYFKKLQGKLKGLDRSRDKEEYLRIIKENAEDIRENVLQYLMVRRTRTIIDKHYKKDLERQKLKFPVVKDPTPVIYSFDKKTDVIFTKTLDLVIKKFKYSRYTPLLYLKEELDENQKTPQRNMGKWMKILLLKRLESSFFAFKQSISRFIYSYTRFIEEFEKGNVYVSEKYTSKVFELLEDDDQESVEKLISEDKAKKIDSKQFKKEFMEDLKSDVSVLHEIKQMWDEVNNDPKLEKFVSMLKKDKILAHNKLIVFTESKETAEYVTSKLNPLFNDKVLSFSSLSSEETRSRIIRNFDPASKVKADDIRILVTTEILSEGVNLNRSNVVINYDIPWNPVRIMQRVGRINRVAKNLPFDEIYTYNFFPAGPVNDEILLKEAAEAKIKAFIEMLGNDARLLTDEEVKSHDFLFRRINSKEAIVGEDESDDPELKWLLYLRDIRDNKKDLFEKVKKLPKKARTAKLSNEQSVVTFFRKGKLRKIYTNTSGIINEIDFKRATELLEAKESEHKKSLIPEFYKMLDQNKKEFESFFVNEVENTEVSSTGNEAKFRKIVKAIISAKEFTDDDEEYLNKILELIKDGALPKPTIKKILGLIKGEGNPLKVLARIRAEIPRDSEFFQSTVVSYGGNMNGPKEVILSEMLIKHGN
jgi:superfamily II DNA/RNA helicase